MQIIIVIMTDAALRLQDVMDVFGTSFTEVSEGFMKNPSRENGMLVWVWALVFRALGGDVDVSKWEDRVVSLTTTPVETYHVATKVNAKVSHVAVIVIATIAADLGYPMDPHLSSWKARSRIREGALVGYMLTTTLEPYGVSPGDLASLRCFFRSKISLI